MPTPNPQAYDDPAMHFGAPDGYTPLPRPRIDPGNLSQPVIAAAWAKKIGKDSVCVITVVLEPFDGDLGTYISNVEDNLRSSSGGSSNDGFMDNGVSNADDENDDATFFHQTQTTTPNGMPAMWVHFDTGSGFNSREGYEYVWVDGVRGVQVQIVGPRGSMTEAQAKAALQDVRGVLYPQQQQDE